MAISHAASGQLVNVQPLTEQLTGARTTALFKTGTLEVMRVVLPAHKTMPSHQVKGDITIHCLEGEIELTAHGQTQRMRAGQLMWLAGGVDHALTARQDSSLLVTLVLQQ
jgi:quercetin dioxygenase-like cupin family protein